MAYDSASPSATATIIEEAMEKKVNDEIMQKQTEIVDVVKDKPESDSVQIVVKEEQVDQTLIDDNKLTAESKKESPVAVMEEVSDAEGFEESAEKVKDESGVQKNEGEQVLKECVEEVNVGAVDEEKDTVEDIVEEDKEEKSVEVAEKEDVEIVDETKGKHGDEIKDVEDVSAHVEFETTEVKVSKVESYEANESDSEVEVKAEEKSEKKEEAEEVVFISQDLVSQPNREPEIVADLSPAEFVEKISAEGKHVVEEPSKDEEENESKEKDVEKKDLNEDESIKKDGLKQTDSESKEKEMEEKVAEALETEPDVKENGEAKQEADMGAKDVGVKPKHSSNIISKVKQSFIKAKKAIIGTSPSSKTISTEAKEEIKVK